MIDVAALRQALVDARYTHDGVTDAIGAAGRAGLAQNSTLVADRGLGDRNDPLAVLIRLFLLQRPQPADAVAAALGGPGNAEELTVADGPQRLAAVDIRPYDSPDDGATGWLVSDLTPGLDTAPPVIRDNWVLGASSASRSLTEITVPGRVGRALDLGTGCGVQSLHLARRADHVVATDINPRAVELARLTLALSGAEVDVREGSLFEPVAGEEFDLIVSNPPFVMAPPTDDPRLTYRQSNLPGDELVRRVVTEGAARLAPGGVLQVLTNWAHTSGVRWEERLEGWLEPSGCDAHVVERERLSPDAYARMWLTDAGMDGHPRYLAAHAEWLDHLAATDVTDIGFGWVTVRRPARPRQPHRRLETWPHAVAQPVGPALAAHMEAMVRVGTLTGDELWQTTWRCAEDVDSEATGRPGAEDPRHLVLRQRSGLCRAHLCDTALMAVVGACDGELPLGVIVDAVADLIDEPAARLRERLEPQLRELIVDGVLR